MSDMQQRIEALYRSDVRGSIVLIVCLWAAVLFVLVMTWPHIPDQGIKVVVTVAAFELARTSSLSTGAVSYSRTSQCAGSGTRVTR